MIYHRTVKTFCLFYLFSHISLCLGAPGDILYQNQFDTNAQVTNDWTRSSGNGNDFQANTAFFSSSPRSLRIRDGSGGTSNNGLINAAVPNADVSFWLRQNTGGNGPEDGENLEFYYFDSSGSWILLATYLGADAAGTIYNETFSLPADALHGNLRFQFNMTAGGNADRWYVDDFIVTETAPSELIPPIANDDNGNTVTAGSVNIDLASNDTDADSGINIASINIVTGATNGSVIVNLDGTVDYTHDGGITTTDSFTYTINDNAGNISNVATVLLTIQLLSCETYADDFNSGTTNNNTGTQNFSTDWNFRSVTQGGLGFAQMANNRLQLQGNNSIDNNLSDPYDYDNNWAERNVDLGAYISATLSFEFIAVGTLETEDEALLEISNDGGASFTTLQIFNGYTTTTTVSVNIDISSYISTSSDTRIRIRIQEDDNSTACCFGATGEYIEIENLEIQACSAAAAVDHYRIEHDGVGLTCEAESITIKACADSNCAALSSNLVSLDFQADGITQSSPSFTGSTVVSLVQTTPDILSLSVANPTIVASNPLICDDGIGNSCDIVFTDTGFKFYADGVVDALGNQIAGKTSNIAPGNQSLTLRAIQANPATGQCDALINNATENIGFAYQCSDPASCAITSNGMAINGSQIIDDVSSGYTNISISFDASGTGTLTLNYLDAGEIRLLANANLDVGGVATVNVQGSSNLFKVRPFAYDIQVAGNPDATTASDPIFATAGNNFNTTIRSILWQSGDDLNNDGAADAGADLTDNGTTPNITNISGSITLTPIPQIVTNSGALGVASVNFSDFSSGTVSVLQSWNEVGIMTINASTPAFMTTGGAIAGTRTNIGRFIPDHFAMSSPVIIEQCGSFTYAGFFDGVNPGLDKNGQTFDVSGTITAQNLSNATTQNYVGTFAKLLSTDISLQGFNATTSTNATGRVNFSPAALNFVNGVSGYSDPVVDYQYDIIAAPFNLRLDLSATDSDSVTSGTINSNEFEVRLGRMRLIDSYGPETANLEMRLFIDYFDGTSWIINTQDSCSTYIDSNVSFDLTSYTDQLADGETSIFAPMLAETVVNGMSDASNGLWFNAPGNNNFGSVLVELDLSTQSWLRFDWDADVILDDASARLNFGYYRGSDRVIYWKEVRN